MTRRFTTGAILIAVLALFAGACSSSDSDAADEKTTTTEKKTTTTDAEGTDADETTDTVSDEDFDDKVSDVAAQIELAGTDVCALVGVLAGLDELALPDPSNPQQVMSGVALYDIMANAIADTAGPDHAAEADAIRASATQYTADAVENEYDPAWFNDQTVDPISTGPAADAYETFFTSAATACTEDTTTTAAG